MAIFRVSEIRKMDQRTRAQRLKELRTELMTLRVRVATGGMFESPGRIREIRRTIARILTINHEERR